MEVVVGKAILVVDDDSIMLQYYESILKEKGHIVISCKDGQSALTYVLSLLRPDLIITDYRMPGIDGLDFIAQLKHIVPEIPVIMSSLYMRSELYERGLSLGIAAFLLKPFSSQELLLAVDTALGTTSGRQG